MKTMDLDHTRLDLIQDQVMVETQTAAFGRDRLRTQMCAQERSPMGQHNDKMSLRAIWHECLVLYGGLQARNSLWRGRAELL
jgi:hypothetical protein